MQCDFDFHNHTPLSRCSKKDYTVGQMMMRMKEAGLARVGFCDHYYADETDPLRDIEKTRSAIREVAGIEAYVGVEVDMLFPGHLDADEKTLAPYDYVAVACPHWHNLCVARPIGLTADALAQAQYDLLLSLTEMPFVDVVVHPFTFSSAAGYMPVDQEALMARYTQADFDRLIEGLLGSDIAVELHANLKKPDYARSLMPFLRRCVSRGVHFSLGSDAHELRWVGSILGASDLIQSLRIPDELAFCPKRRAGKERK